MLEFASVGTEPESSQNCQGLILREIEGVKEYMDSHCSTR